MSFNIILSFTADEHKHHVENYKYW